MGDLGFFGIGEKDYSETFSVRSCFSNCNTATCRKIDGIGDLGVANRTSPRAHLHCVGQALQGKALAGFLYGDFLKMLDDFRAVCRRGVFSTAAIDSRFSPASCSLP
jgi:hypothetical protein